MSQLHPYLSQARDGFHSHHPLPPGVPLSEVSSACLDVFGGSKGAQDKLTHGDRAATTQSTNWASQAVLGQAELRFQSFPREAALVGHGPAGVSSGETASRFEKPQTHKSWTRQAYPERAFVPTTVSWHRSPLRLGVQRKSLIADTWPLSSLLSTAATCAVCLTTDNSFSNDSLGPK